MENIFEFLVNFPVVTNILVIMGAARAIFKPLCAAINKYVEESESLKDNELWAKIQGHIVFKVISKILDYSLSIKLPQK